MTLLMGGVPSQVASGTAALVDRLVAAMFAMLDRLAAGDAMTWLAFVSVALFVLLLVGLWTGSITITREK